MKKILYIYIINIATQAYAMNTRIQWNPPSKDWLTSRLETETNTVNNFNAQQIHSNEQETTAYNSLVTLGVFLDHAGNNIVNRRKALADSHLPNIMDDSLEGEDDKDNWVSDKELRIHRRRQKESAYEEAMELIIIPHCTTIYKVGSTCKNLHAKQQEIISPLEAYFQNINVERIANFQILLNKVANNPAIAFKDRLDMGLVRTCDWFKKAKIYKCEEKHNPFVFQYPNLLTIADVTLNVGRPLFNNNNVGIAKLELYHTFFNLISQLENKPIEGIFIIEDNEWLKNIGYCVIPVTQEEKEKNTFILNRRKEPLTSEQKIFIRIGIHFLNSISSIARSIANPL